MDGLSTAAFLSVLGLIIAATGLIETSAALLMGYRNKPFLLGIVVANVPTSFAYHILAIRYFSDVNGRTLPILFGIYALLALMEVGLLFIVFRKRYSVRELVVLGGIMNATSFVILVLLLGNVIY